MQLDVRERYHFELEREGFREKVSILFTYPSIEKLREL